MPFESLWPHRSSTKPSRKWVFKIAIVFIGRGLREVVNHLKTSSYHYSCGRYHSTTAKDTKHKLFKTAKREQTRSMIRITSCNPGRNKAPSPQWSQLISRCQVQSMFCNVSDAVIRCLGKLSEWLRYKRYKDCLCRHDVMVISLRFISNCPILVPMTLEKGQF